MQRRWKARTALVIAAALAGSLAIAGAQEAREAPPQPAGQAAPEVAGEQAPAASTVEDAGPPARDTRRGDAGIRVQLDPLTGELLRKPAEPGAEGQPVEDATPPVTGPRGWLNTYGDDLLQEPLPGGGFKVDLRGRFQSSVVATIDPETGAVEVDCVVSRDPAETADDR